MLTVGCCLCDRVSIHGMFFYQVIELGDILLLTNDIMYIGT